MNNVTKVDLATPNQDDGAFLDICAKAGNFPKTMQT
jgi:hypothetical protein